MIMEHMFMYPVMIQQHSVLASHCTMISMNMISLCSVCVCIYKRIYHCTTRSNYNDGE